MGIGKNKKDLQADDFRPVSPEEKHSKNDAIVSGGVSEGFGVSAIRKYKLAFIVSIIIFSAFAAIAYVIVKQQNANDNISDISVTPGLTVEEQRNYNLEAEILEAMSPVNSFDFKAAKVNLNKIAASNDLANKNEFFLVQLFYVCLELNDQECLEKTGKQLNKITSAEKLKSNDVSSTLIKKIEEYK